MNADIAVAFEIVRKTYGATVALDGMSFSVPAGSVHALLGENGAGKSTTVKMLSGLVQPDAGTIRVFGEDCTIRSPRAGPETPHPDRLPGDDANPRP